MNEFILNFHDKFLTKNKGIEIFLIFAQLFIVKI